MSNATISIEIHADATSCDVLRAYFKRCDIGIEYSLIETAQKDFIDLIYNEKTKSFAVPLRLGQILDQIKNYKKKHHKGEKYLTFKSGVLDTHHSVFKKENGEEITLTEKELEILAYLHAQKDQVISRENLLKAIWNYAENVETHTLETHIYRLRQKIEKNPAQPDVLITKEDGYCVYCD